MEPTTLAWLDTRAPFTVLCLIAAAVMAVWMVREHLAERWYVAPPAPRRWTDLELDRLWIVDRRPLAAELRR